MDRRRLASVIVAGSCVVLPACGDDDVTSSPTVVDVPETVAMGVLPQPLSNAATLPAPPPPPTTESAATTTSTPALPEEPIEAPVGALVDGNRMLLVGDSVLASAAPRNGGQLCDALVLFGWQAEIDAASDQGIDFGSTVLNERLSGGASKAHWDVVAFVFGSDVDATDTRAVDQFDTALGELIDRVSPRPVLLFTLAGDDRAAVNAIIRAEPEAHPNALVVEFADAGDDGVPVVDDSGRTLTDDGMKRFSIRTAAAAGDAPGDGNGSCLPTQYLD
jgi:hypothetical protein